MFQSPTAFFIGGLNAREKQFEYKFLKSARENGYTRFIEPCSGELNNSQIASDVGFAQIEASDVTLFSTLLGFYVCGKSIDQLEVTIDGEPCNDIVDVMYKQWIIRLMKEQGSYYYDVIIKDAIENEEKHKENIKNSLDSIKARFGNGFMYNPLDILEHIERVKNDEHAIIMANVPTYTGGYEKFYDTDGRVQWNEPSYTLLQPGTSQHEIKEMLKDAKCLALFYEEAPAGETVFDPLYVRFETRRGINAYITTNDLERAKFILSKQYATRGNALEMKPLKCNIVHRDYEFKKDSKIDVIPIGTKETNYYRRLLTHNFVGSSGDKGFAVIVDGMLVGVFGYTTQMFGEPMGDTLYIQFSIGVGCENFRTNRLLTMIEKCLCIAEQRMNDLDKFSYKFLQTAMFSKYPESKQHRGIMKLYRREKDKQTGLNKLIYRTEFVKDTIEETYDKWITKELEYRKSKR